MGLFTSKGLIYMAADGAEKVEFCEDLVLAN